MKQIISGLLSANLLADIKNREELNEFNAGAGSLLIKILDLKLNSGKSIY